MPPPPEAEVSVAQLVPLLDPPEEPDDEGRGGDARQRQSI
jgi:hypothetical protein